MTHEVQGRMLLREWFAWWEAIPKLDAEARIGDYNILLLGSPGWDGINREERLRTLFDQAYGHGVAPQANDGGPTPQDDVHQQMRKAYFLMSTAFGPAVVARGQSLN